MPAILSRIQGTVFPGSLAADNRVPVCGIAAARLGRFFTDKSVRLPAYIVLGEGARGQRHGGLASRQDAAIAVSDRWLSL
jgi:hypothetical protein